MEKLEKFIDRINRELVSMREDKPFDDIVSSHIRFGRKLVGIIFSKNGCELEIYDSVKGTFLDNVAFYCEPRVFLWDEIEVSETTDEWNNNGFAGASDYYSWRY